MRAEQRPLLKNCFFSSLAYLATTWICVWLLRHGLADAPIVVRALVGMLPTVPIVFAIRAVVKLVLAGDELQRRIDLEAFAIASVALGLGCLTASLLIVADVIVISGRQALLWVFPIQWIAYGFAKIWATNRYQ
ncbi:MAG: hypothetical protein ABI451_08495 [Dokdonella sp.]